MLLEIALTSLLTPVNLQEYQRNILCGQYDELVSMIRGPHVVKKDSALGPNVEGQGGQSLVERWEDEDGFYLVIQHWANGNACIVIVGTNWKTLPESSI
jgi:hypothetical protein